MLDSSATADLYVVVVGNVIDGVCIYGPYTEDEIDLPFHEIYDDLDWVLTKLTIPIKE